MSVLQRSVDKTSCCFVVAREIFLPRKTFKQGCSGLIEQVTELCDGEIFGWIVRAPVQEFDGSGMACLPLGHRQRAGIFVLKCLKNKVDELNGCCSDIRVTVVID